MKLYSSRCRDYPTKIQALSYEVHGSIEKITSYDNATVGSGSVVNEVVRE